MGAATACSRPSKRLGDATVAGTGQVSVAAVSGAGSAANASGTPTPQAPTPVAPHSYFPEHRIVAFYGSPLSPIMGVLGDGDQQTMLDHLRQQAAAYAQADPTRAVTPALELIEGVAQDSPTDNGQYLYREDPTITDQYTKIATDNNMLLILDEQIGHSTPEDEVQRLLPRLSAPNVELALDPEFDMPPGVVPGQDLGSMDANDINQVQAMLEDVAVRHGLPFKILIVHQFQIGMIVHPEQLQRYPHVDLVLDADGFGTRDIKLEKYQGLITNRPAGHAGLKLFYKYDPDIWTPANVLALDPPPDVIIYQ